MKSSRNFCKSFSNASPPRPRVPDKLQFIKELRLIKISDKGDKYRYALPGKESNADIRLRYTAVLTHAVITIQCAQNLVVVKTIPGSAQGCAMAIETLEFDNIVGVIAGDDTLFIAMSNEEDAKAFSEKLNQVVN